MKKYLSLFILSFLFALQLQAEEYKAVYNSDSTELSIYVNLDIDKTLLDDAKNEALGEPLRLAKIYSLELNMDSVGEWVEYDNGWKSWKFSIDLVGSHGVIAFFKELYIPQGAQLYVYNEDRNMPTSAYDWEQNPLGGKYTLELGTGSKLVMEYNAPQNIEELPRFVLSELAYKYKNLTEGYYIQNNGLLRSLNNSANACIPNINCPEGDEWQTQKKGVVRLRTRMDRWLYSCSGSLVNNTNEDRSPLVLTAEHCFYTQENFLLDLEMTEFFFDYEHPACENLPYEPQLYKKLTGAEKLAFSSLNGGGDGALLRLKTDIPLDWDVHFNGWDITNSENKNLAGTTIQHPHGDVKKIAVYNRALWTVTWFAESVQGATNAHWAVQYSTGVSQGGSSGSPIFNQEKLIVGTLTGGNTSCTNLGGTDYYGKMWYHWNQAANRSSHMQAYLDPNNKLKDGKLRGFPVTNGGIIDPEEQATVSIYNNAGVPTIKGLLNIEYIRVINLQGYILLQKTYENTRYIELNSFPMGRGVHFVEAYTSDGKKHKLKFIN